MAGPTVTLCGYEVAVSCSIQTATATCPAGTTLISGGYVSDGAYPWMERRNGNSWTVGMENTFAYLSTEIHAEATCAS